MTRTRNSDAGEGYYGGGVGPISSTGATLIGVWLRTRQCCVKAQGELRYMIVVVHRKCSRVSVGARSDDTHIQIFGGSVRDSRGEDHAVAQNVHPHSIILFKEVRVDAVGAVHLFFAHAKSRVDHEPREFAAVDESNANACE